MRILYGVTGEGMGHAMRSRVILDELSKRHDVQVVVSGRAHDYLKARESDRLGVKRIWGMSIVYEDNEVRNFRTFLENLKGAVLSGGWPKNVRAYYDLALKFEPEVVISDFETWSYLYGRSAALPVISLDNIQILNRCTQPPEVLAGHEAEFLLAKSIVKAKLPGCFHYLVTTFFRPPPSKPRTSLHPPVLRPEILAARPERGDHLLVYQTSTSDESLPDVLGALGRECRVYGYRRDLREEVRDGLVRYRPFSEKDFIEDLRTARAVVANGGFTLLSESVYLHKPVLSVPVRGQFEQVLNARWIELLGYGLAAEALTADALSRFLERVPACEERLAGYSQDGNREILAHLEELLESARGKSWDYDPGRPRLPDAR